MFGERLKLARKRAGLSLRELSARLQNRVSAQAIGKYEAGQMFPSSSVLVALGDALNVDLDFLTSTQVAELCGVEFRKDAQTKVKEAAKVEAAVIDRVERYLAIEAVLELQSEAHDLADRKPHDVASYDEAEAIANQLRADWQLGIDPIPSVAKLLEEKGIKVLALDMPAHFFGLTCEVKRSNGLPSLPVIVVSTSITLERRRFTLCHELGHRLIGGTKNELDYEKAMHRFASAFLMPASSLREEFGNERHALAYAEIKSAKHFYGVSAAALIVRLRDLNIIRDGYLTYLFQTMARTWRSTEPDPLLEQGEKARDEEPERFEKLVYRALAEQLIALPKASMLLQKPTHDVEFAIRGAALADANSRQ
ncbi:XRE family transcriptional regulator [Bradyrhizobium sp. CCGUVB4N]|uniref:helix-turn-helix domain-containing protein n=1 Tax=Bradyrhizobium sp. CCGUVB4N TaxID=2949631 RepID=UPI0020B18131|nr:XRE family transcriptional regulator [Bradyrhizobium sp. CCGUVB4N]MCP3385934.1 XRE family transcriptional regulator [Bradyrhizobium sp. CCGUVB4N]